MKFPFLKFVVGVFLILGSVQATDDEDTSKFPQLKSAQQSTTQRETLFRQQISLLIPYEEDAFEGLPDKFLVAVFEFLDVNNLGRVAQVSIRWKMVRESLFYGGLCGQDI